MTRFAWLVGLLGICSCAHEPVHAPTPGSVAFDTLGLERMLEAQCGSCHDGEPGRPTFDGHSPLDRAQTVRVALAVGGGLMPPPPSRLIDADRRRLIALSCARTATPGSGTEACIEQLGRPAPEAWLLGLDAMMRVVDSVADRLIPSLTFDDATMKKMKDRFVLVDPDDRSIRLDGSLSVLLSLYAAERCGNPQAVGAEVYRSCVIEATDYRPMVLRSTSKSPSAAEQPRVESTTKIP